MSNKNFIHAKDGLIIGCEKNNKLYRSDGYQHLLLIAPTGTGKGVAFTIPNLLSWQESVIVHDIKLENFELTSGWRASQGQNIYRFSPLAPKTHCYNPLDFVTKDSDKLFDDLQKIAFLLLPDHHSCCEKHGHSNPRNLFIALALYLMAHPEKPKTFGEIFRMLTSNLVVELTKGIKKHKIHSSGLILIQNFLNFPEKKRYRIIASLESHLELWSNPLIDKATSKSDFNPTNFKKEKATLYVGLEPIDSNRLKPLLQFFYQHMMQSLCHHDESTKHGVLFILDDFPRIGKMDLVTSLVSYARGYKVKLALTIQNLNDLKSAYCEKGANAIINNVNFKIAYSSNSLETTEFIKERTKIDLMSLAQDQQVILIDVEKPMITKKLRYYDLKEFNNKITEPIKLKN
jgi:type IV secretion system protein VirD4